MTTRQKQCLQRMGNKISFEVWLGLIKSIYDLSKDDIRELKNDLLRFEKEEKNNILWQQDKDVIKSIINDWCIAYRCYSLYLK